jgi:hypothetical protein
MYRTPNAFTQAELDEARALEANRLWLASDRTESPSRIAARLAREGFIPPPEPITLEARKIAAAGWEESGFPFVAIKYRSGEYDGSQYLKDLTAALKRGMEIARNEVPRPDHRDPDPSPDPSPSA